VKLDGTGPINVTGKPRNIESLASGNVVELQFNITVNRGAKGWYELPLYINYQRQADVSVSEGEVTPLYKPENCSIMIRVFVDEPRDALKIIGIKSELSIGTSGTLIVVIKNDGPDFFHNCSLELVTAPPFLSESEDVFMGDLAPGELSLASFSVYVDGNASLQDYQLGAIVNCREKSILLALPLTLTKADSSIWSYLMPILALMMIVLLVALILQKKRRLLPKIRRGR
jgi:hypothetical protein